MPLIGVDELQEAWDTLFDMQKSIYAEHMDVNFSDPDILNQAMSDPTAFMEVKGADTAEELVRASYERLGFDPDALIAFSGDLAFRVLQIVADSPVGPVVVIHMALLRAMTIGAQAMAQRIEDEG